MPKICRKIDEILFTIVQYHNFSTIDIHTSLPSIQYNHEYIVYIKHIWNTENKQSDITQLQRIAKLSLKSIYSQFCQAQFQVVVPVKSNLN